MVIMLYEFTFAITFYFTLVCLFSRTHVFKERHLQYFDSLVEWGRLGTTIQLLMWVFQITYWSKYFNLI
jgi:hypothetical protein